MTTKNFQFPASDSTKQEEIEFLTRMVNQVTPGTYLAGLLNSRLLDWFSQQARNDFTCDVMDEIENLRGLLNKEEAEHREYVRAYQEMSAQIEKLQNKAVEFGNATEAEIKHLTDVLNGVYAQRDNAWSENSNLLEEVQTLRHSVEVQEQQIVALKAKLYDLMVK